MASEKKPYKAYSGNRFNLRAKALHQIIRIEALASSMGPLGDFLITNLMGLLIAMLVFAIGVFVEFLIIGANGGATAGRNWYVILMVGVATVLLTLNTILTNPAKGSQLVVSMKYLFKKMLSIGKRNKKERLRIFKFDENDTTQGTVVTMYRQSKVYMSVYSVRGTISPVNFDDQLEYLAAIEHNVLTTPTRDIVLSTVNSIEEVSIKPAVLPKNATPAMREMRKRDYEITSHLPINQQLRTNIVITADTPESLWTERESLQTQFRKGLVVGYNQLRGKDLKEFFKGIYGG